MCYSNFSLNIIRSFNLGNTFMTCSDIYECHQILRFLIWKMVWFGGRWGSWEGFEQPFFAPHAARQLKVIFSVYLMMIRKNAANLFLLNFEKKNWKMVQGNLYTGEGALLLVQLSINFKLSCWKKRKRKYCFENNLSKSWLTTAQVLVHLPPV